MKIPKHIDKLLEQRAKAAEKFIAADSAIVDWLEKNDIKVSNDDILTGAVSLMEPYGSIENIRECIRKKNEEPIVFGRPGSGSVRYHFRLEEKE